MAIIWEPDFSQACSFCRMLMNHKNFCFTQIPDKTNDMIFWKSLKTLFWDKFWPLLVIFARWGFFPKNPAVACNYIWAPNTMLSFFLKKEPILRQLTDRRKEGRTLFYRTLPAEARGPINITKNGGTFIHFLLKACVSFFTFVTKWYAHVRSRSTDSATSPNKRPPKRSFVLK